MFTLTYNEFSILWNGEKLPLFKPSRGLRQGDPLSPYLFVLCLEKLSHLINEAVSMGQWIPLSITSRGPHLSHVCFADDIVLFVEASTAQLSSMMAILNSFCDASGEKVSLAKSKILVSKNVPHWQALSISAPCAIPLTDDLGKYLGATMINERVTKLTYNSLISRTQARLNSWAKKDLSMAGRVTLLNSLIITMKSYLIQTSLFPDNIIKEIEKIMRGFLWGDTVDKRKLHTISWDKVCLPKDHGVLKNGLSF